MIMDIIRPGSGDISIFGNGTAGAVKRRIGYMPEERGLYRKMTVGKVLGYFGALKGLTRGEIMQGVPRWLERVGLANWANKKVEDLSRGMHQKLQFAVTCISEPELLIFDEPFAGLDPVNLDILKTIILDMRKQGRTVVFSTHVMDEAERLCDFIILINKGKSVVDGKLEQVRSQWKPHAVYVELEGDADFIEDLPAVRSVKAQGRRLEVSLADDAEPQELLQLLVGRAKVRVFEVKVPSLHEIFVRLVEADNAQDI
jgi:ABC-2 type transport system ATP-binding protein